MNADPRDSSWRYDQGSKASKYRERSSARRDREARLLESLLSGCEIGTTLDAPCGAGRLAELIESLGGTWHGCDLSASMLHEAKLAGAKLLIRGRAEALPFGEDAFDTVLCFRFLHHLRPDLQEPLLREIARVSAARIVLSGFAPLSFHEMQRRLRIAFSRRERARFPTKISAVDRVFGELGFARKAIERDGFGRDLWIGRWERER